MRIPLDYYRILGLPIQATVEQLRQAHRDRALQLPRREYSDAAIASRKRLLDEAYAVLSNPEQRQAYDASFLAKTYELGSEPEQPVMASDRTLAQSLTDSSTDSHTPSIDVQDDQFVGTLLVLQDLGEYELVLKLGRPFLTGGSASLKNGQFGDPTIIFPDIVLTVTLACLELGREQWQQGQYENAAEALETGQQLLLREGFFAEVRGEVQTDLYKLRPYRVLELLALPEQQTAQRYRGMQLLQDMLQERDGIDGTSSDQSGLNIDDFLRFIQQLRGYLTVAEQQVLFEEEAQRPSAVATYLAVYALLARGFAERQPALVRRAKLMLLRLSSRQDVHLEQSVCSLLLGQTEEASRALELSQEYGPIAFIREHSQNSPDLLPGLCLYAERWLQDEVFPHFRDLAQQRASLKDYFADPQVQEYLEELPSEPETADTWSFARSRTATAQSAAVANAPVSARFSANGLSQSSVALKNGRRAVDELEVGNTLIDAAREGASRSATATLAPDRVDGVSTMPAAERSHPPGPESSRPPQARQRGHGDDSGGGVNPDAALRSSIAERSRRRSQKQAGVLRWLLPLAVITGMIALGFLVAWLLRSWQSTAKSDQPVEQPLVQLDQPVIPLPTAAAINPATATSLSNDSAQKIIQSWLSAKAAAMGSEHKTAQLEQVLADPKLSEWRGAAEEAKRDNWYKQYKHDVKVTSIEQDRATPNQARVLAEVSESEEYYTNGRLEDSKSDPKLQIRYSLTQIEGKWRIQNWEILP